MHRSSRARATFVDVVLFAALLLPALASFGCNEQTINALRPRFDISWPEEFGFVAGDLPTSAIVFGSVTTGTIAEFEVSITNSGNADLEVHDIYFAVAQFDENGDLANELRLEADPELSTNALPGRLPNGTSYRFELRFTPLYGLPLQSDLHLVVVHELNDDDPLYIPISGEGFGEPVPDIYAKPPFVNFGTLEIGVTSPESTVNVGNAGPGTLVVGAVSLDDTVNFSLNVGAVANGTFELGDVAFLNVTYHPTTQGDHTGTITIVSNDPDEQPFTIELNGIGDPPEIGKRPTAICSASVASQGQTGQNISILHDCSGGNCPTVVFSGIQSTDPSGLALIYAWTKSGPAGNSSNLSSNSSPNPSLTLDVAGTYSATLIVTNSNAQSSDPCVATVEAIPNENFRVEMSWQYSGDDMDLHLLRANPVGVPETDGDCYYANCVSGGGWGAALDWGVSGQVSDDPALDLDDISGVGPENINIPAPAGAPYDGWYQIFVNDYPGSVYSGSNPVTVSVYLNGILVQTYNFSISGEDNDYYVAKIHWPTGQVVACNGLAGCP